MSESCSQVTKRCTVCGEIKALCLFVRDRKIQSGYGSWCSACKNSARYRRRQRTGLSECEREAKRRSEERGRNELSDRYIRTQLATTVGLIYAEIPQSIVEMKREQLRLRRLAKELAQASTTAKEHDDESVPNTR
jgi:hypothetical protein